MPFVQLPPKNGALGYGLNGLQFEKLPDRFQCKVCQKSKESSPFYYSKKELKTFTERAQRGWRLNSVTAKLRCRECSGDPPDGIWCTHCEMIKPREDISQAARNRPAEAWCRPCILWQESVEATTGDNYALALPVPSFVVPKEADRTYTPETPEEKEPHLAKAKMGPRSSKTSSAKPPSVDARDVIIGSVASWLCQMDTAHATNSLVDEEDAAGIANYRSIASVVNGKDNETFQAPRASLFKNMLQRKQQTPSSLLDMDNGGLLLAAAISPLSPNALFSNTILSLTTSHAAWSASLMSFEADDSWKRLENNKKGPNQKVMSLLDGPSNDEELIAYRSNPDGTFKYAPKAEFKLEEDLLGSEHQDVATTSTEGPRTARAHKLSLSHDLLASNNEQESPIGKLTLSVPQFSDVRSSGGGSSKNVKSLVVDDEVSRKSKADYSRAFFGVDPFSRNTKGKEAAEEKGVDMATTTSQARLRSSTSASTDDKMYEAAILRYNSKHSTFGYQETALTAPAATKPRPAHSTREMQAPSLDRELQAAGVSLGEKLIAVGMNSMTTASKQSRDAIARAQQLAQQFAQDEEDDYDDGYNVVYDDDDY